MKIFWKDLVAFSPEGAAAGDGGAGAGAAVQQQPAAQQQSSGQPQNLAEAAARLAGNEQRPGDQQQPNGQQPPNGQQTPQAYYPQDLPEPFRGSNDRETIDKLYGEISSRPKAPATAKDYKYEFEAGFTEKFGDLKDDPVLPMWSEIAHEIGLDNKTAQDVVPKLFEKLSKAGLIPEPVDINAEMAKLEPNETDPVRRQTKAATRVNAMASTLKGLETRGILNKNDMVRTSIVFADAANVAAFEKIFKLIPGEHGLQNSNGQGGPAGQSKESITQAMKDPRYDSMSPKYDAAYRKQVDADWRRVHGAA